VLRQTIRKSMQAKLKEIRTELRRSMHDSPNEVGQWLRAVVGGHFRYYGVPTKLCCTTGPSLARGTVLALGLVLPKPDGLDAMGPMRRLLGRGLPPTRICHPYPSVACPSRPKARAG
jgi:RNA-directed DNA polymerase